MNLMKRVGVLLATGFEEVEALTVVDLLRRSKIEVNLISITGETQVLGARNISVLADEIYDFEKIKQLDLIVLPGGLPGTNHLEESEFVIKAIRYFTENNKPIAAICAAPRILGKMGLLNKKRACCYPDFENCLLGASVSKNMVEVDGTFITSRGVATAIPFALELIEVLQGKEAKRSIASAILWSEYND